MSRDARSEKTEPRTTVPGWGRRFGLDLLAVRVIAFLTIALLPIGVIAMLQSQKVREEVDGRSALTLLALTAEAATTERQVFQRAFGAAEALGIVEDLLVRRDDCYAYLSQFMRERGLYVFVGFVKPDGSVTCSTSRDPVAVAVTPQFIDLVQAPRPNLRIIERGAVSGENVVVVSQPVFDDTGLRGFMHLSIPRDRIATDMQAPGRISGLTDLITFNHLGEVITSRNNTEISTTLLPDGRKLADFVGPSPTFFEGVDQSGIPRLYAVTPIIPGIAYAMGIWPDEPNLPDREVSTLPIWLFPLVTWVSSLIVAFYAIHRLVIRDVTRLRRVMRRFATDRYLPPAEIARPMARELRDIEDEFKQMAANIVQDEAQLENTVRERGILLKEVHHRVKNNLQLISSVISMKMRRSSDEATKLSLGRIQERVLGLATIHRSLYQSDDLGRIDTATLIRDIVGQQALTVILGDAMTVTLDLDDVSLLPDQAVPLALLTAEAISNAVSHLEMLDPDRRWITLVLRDVGDGRGEITIANATRPGIMDDVKAAVRSENGLGRNLIQAFASQMGGPLEVTDTGSEHRLRAAFSTDVTLRDAQDY